MSTETDDFDAYYALHQLKVGNILSQQQVAAIQKVLQDLDDEMESSVAIHAAARTQVLQELGGDSLVKLVEEKDIEGIKNTIDRVMRQFKEKLEPPVLKGELPRQLNILREQFNADLREATRDGIDRASLIALSGAIAEDLLLALPVKFRKIGVDCVIDGLEKRVCPTKDEEGIV